MFEYEILFNEAKSERLFVDEAVFARHAELSCVNDNVNNTLAMRICELLCLLQLKKTSLSTLSLDTHTSQNSSL